MRMGCPTLEQLPPPPPGKTGWPWTEESPQLPDAMPDGRPWPRVSIITPSYQQGQFIEETIRSILLQGYPNLEYSIIDGGSTDGSVAVIKKYSDWLSYWECQPDRGQSHAINKGFRCATGEILTWLNSDDRLTSGALAAVATILTESPACPVVTGDYEDIDLAGTPMRKRFGMPLGTEDLIVCRRHLGQPATFYTRTVLDRVGLLDESLHYSMDHELFIRMRLAFPFAYTPRVLAQLRLHPEAKTVSQRLPMLLEIIRACRRYWGRFPSVVWFRRARECHRRIAQTILLLAAEFGVARGDLRNAAICLVRGCFLYPPHMFSRLVFSLSFRILLGKTVTEKLRGYIAR